MKAAIKKFRMLSQKVPVVAVMLAALVAGSLFIVASVMTKVSNYSNSAIHGDSITVDTMIVDSAKVEGMIKILDSTSALIDTIAKNNEKQ